MLASCVKKLEVAILAVEAEITPTTTPTRTTTATTTALAAIPVLRNVQTYWNSLDFHILCRTRRYSLAAGSL